MDKLIQAAKCALADLIGIYNDGEISYHGVTIVELYEALRELTDISDYAADYEEIRLFQGTPEE